MAETRPNGLEPLIPLTDTIHLFESQSSLGEEEDTVCPSLIVAFTWIGGATARRIQKYIAGWRALWPNASILLIKGRVVDFAYLPTAVLHANLALAREAICRHISRHDPRVLIHMFSNMGLFMAVNLVWSLRAQDDVLLGPYIRGMVFDCSPGRTEFWRAYRAAVVSLANHNLPTRLLGKPTLAVLTGLLVGGHQTGLVGGGMDEMRSKVNEQGLFGSARRLYLYARRDPIVGWRDVEAHMQEARGDGVEVDAVEFEDGLHCALVARDPDRYWAAIREFWHRASEETPRGGLLRSRL